MIDLNLCRNSIYEATPTSRRRRKKQLHGNGKQRHLYTRSFDNLRNYFTNQALECEVAKGNTSRFGSSSNIERKVPSFAEAGQKIQNLAKDR